ncbi:MAG TPA: hydroxyisourate hydrolase [Gemmatimonadaceae bacterium]|nr:hydroxyisourate hydrolase [Gemmatimonadaceae bacterium]
MSTISTHVLDTSLGKPAQGISVELEHGGAIIGSGVTDVDGRVRDLVASGASLDAGDYQLTFSVADYFKRMGRESFYTKVVVPFRIEDSQHYHVPLLLSPFGYSTYRGS